MPNLFNFLKNIPELKLDESKKRILLIYGVSILLVFVGYFAFFLKPSIAKLSSLIPEIRERRAGIKSIQDDLRTEDLLNKRLETLQKRLGSYEKRLSREKELPVLLENLSEMAEKSRVKILGITPYDITSKAQKDTDEEEDVYQEVPIAINAQSGYHELGSFINSLENDQRYMQISHMKIKAGQNNPKRHKIEFVVYAYTFKQ